MLHATAYTLLMVLYMGVFPAAAAYVIWSIAVSHANIAQVVPILYLNPILASTLRWIMLGEHPGWHLALGGLMILAGVWVVQSRGQTDALPAEEDEWDDKQQDL